MIRFGRQEDDYSVRAVQVRKDQKRIIGLTMNHTVRVSDYPLIRRGEEWAWSGWHSQRLAVT